eukprot:TRINITY_DN3957_c0_g1_i23.p1 TRINITY_DN3957_c0_g1~~TRINITY_DN3957_c0_g1_i23.p1  ORF type:complete len:488 (-),score=59.59 TRINITY_DN3957_c0_g1_i23:27-1448(-)
MSGFIRDQPECFWIFNDDSTELEKLLKATPKRVNQKFDGCMRMMRDFRFMRRDRMDYYLMRDRFSNVTLLHLACFFGSTKCAKLLIKLGSDISLKTRAMNGSLIDIDAEAIAKTLKHEVIAKLIEEEKRVKEENSKSGSTEKKKLDLLKQQNDIFTQQLTHLKQQNDHTNQIYTITRKLSTIHKIDELEIQSHTKIVSGAEGCVFRIRCMDMDKDFILKMIYNYQHNNRTSLKNSFDNEYSILSKIPIHPNITLIYHHFIDDIDPIRHLLPPGAQEYCKDKAMFIISEPCQITLEHHFIKKNSNVEERDCLVIGIQICEALSHLIKHRVVHRDINLKNVMLNILENRVNQIVLIDFGLAIRFIDDNLSLPFIHGLHLGGNPLYLPPELKGSVLNYRGTDIFATGCVLFQLMLHKHPFELMKKANYNREEYSKHVSSISYSAPLKDVIWRMIHPNLSERITPSEAIKIMMTLIK